MEQHTKDKFEELFREMIKHEFTASLIPAFLVSTKDNWEYPLPNHVLQQEYMALMFGEWSMENSELCDEGIVATVAFGEEENSKLVPWDEILAVIDAEDGSPIMYRPFPAAKPIAPKMPTKLADIMHSSEGVKKSMSIMRKHNPNLSKKG